MSKVNENLEINSFLSPAYWGSFGAFMIGLASICVVSIYQGPPRYMIPMPEVEVGAEVVFYSTLFLVCIYIVRYYSAVSVQIYAGSEDFLMMLPSPVRRSMFGLLCFLLSLCGVNSIVISGIGILPALVLCAIQSMLSLFCIFGFWISRFAWDGGAKAAPTGFHLGEVFVLGPVLYLLWAFRFGMEKSSPISTIEISLLLGIVLWFSAHEWIKFHYLPLRQQLDQLSTFLASPKLELDQHDAEPAN